MTASAVAAVAPVGVERGSEHQIAGGWIPIARLASSRGAAMRLVDCPRSFAEIWIVRRRHRVRPYPASTSGEALPST